MKKLSLLFVVFCFAFQLKAATSVTTPSISGHWTMAGSPYNIFNDVYISAGQSLTIDPGVEVVFQGSYTLDVYGQFIAQGASGQYINFRVNDTAGWYDKTTPTGGWKGITFYHSSFGATATDPLVSYCNFSNIKAGIIRVVARSITFQNCNIFNSHTSSTAVGSSLLKIEAGTTDNVKLYQSNFYQNEVDKYCSVVQVNGGANAHILQCSFHDNKAISALLCLVTKLLLEKSDFYNNVQQTDLSVTGTVTIYNSNAAIKGNRIYKNTGQDCGALVCHNSFADINSNFICNNQSLVGFTGSSACGMAQGGGAVRISSDDSSAHYYCTIRNNVIANNFAALSGGGIYVFWISARIYNNQIVHNSSGNGTGGFGGNDAAGIEIFNNADIAGRNSVKIRNNLFYENIGYGCCNSYNVMISRADSVEYTNNWSEHFFDKDVSGSPLGYILVGDTATNLVGNNPGLMNPTAEAMVTEEATDKDFRLSPTSVCINKGSTYGIDPGTTDCWNNIRLYGSSIDIGAFEYNPNAYLPNEVPGVSRNSGSFSIHPNPATTSIFITTPDSYGKLQLINIIGGVVAEKNVVDSLTSFDIHALPRGLYLAVWAHGAETTTQKVVVE